MTRSKKNYPLIFISVLELILFALPLVFENLSKTRALVMRHLYTKRSLHLDTFLSEGYRNVYALLIGIATLLILLFIIKKLRINKKYLILLCFIGLAIIAMLSLDVFISNLTYSYTIGILLLIWILEIIKIFIKVKITRKTNMFL